MQKHVTLNNSSVILLVAPTNRCCDWSASISADAKYEAVSRTNALIRERQLPQSIILMHVDPRIVTHQVRSHPTQQLG